MKLENAWPWSGTWFLFQEIHVHSRQTSTWHEQMLTRSTNTRTDGQRKGLICQKKKKKQRNSSKQLQTHNMATNDVEMLTAQIREYIFFSLTSHSLFPEEQKECCKYLEAQ